jgi:hypothetical protein
MNIPEDKVDAIFYIVNELKEGMEKLDLKLEKNYVTRLRLSSAVMKVESSFDKKLSVYRTSLEESILKKLKQGFAIITTTIVVIGGIITWVINTWSFFKQ